MEKIKILIIEDDPNQTFLIKEALDSEQYSLSEISDGKIALDSLIAGNINPDLILLDYHLPGTDGLNILETLRNQEKKFNVIFLTADYSIETAIKAINAGALDFMPKDGRFVHNIPAIVDKAYQTIINRLEREKYESAFLESEQRFKMVMEASKDGIFEWDSAEGMTHVSPNNAQMLGYTTEEYPKTHEEFVQLVHPDDRENLQQRFFEHLKNATSFYEAEVRMKTKDGSYKWILERGIIAEKDSNGRPKRFIGTHSDISGRKAAEKKIIEANSRLTTLISNLPGIVYRCEGTDLFKKSIIGGRVWEITGYSYQELTPQKFSDIILNEDKKIIDLKSFEGVNDFGYYYRIITKNGNTCWLWDHGKVIYNSSGEITSLEGYISDITEMRKNEEALKMSEEEKNIILDNSLHAFILISPDGEVVAFNKVANHRAILNVGKTITKGSDILEYISEEEKNEFQLYFKKVVSGEPYYWEKPINKKNEISCYENVLVPVFLSRGKIKFICYTSSDITDRKAAEEKILYSENLYNSTINSLNDFLCVVDEKLEIVFLNEALIKFNEINELPDNIIGKSFFEIYSFFKQLTKEDFIKVFSSGKEVTMEENLNLSSKQVFIELKVTPVYQAGKVIRVVIIMRDVTERINFGKKIMNAIIETEERERKRFSEDLHDELGSILSTIKIYINTLHREDLEPGKKENLTEFTNQLINQAIQNSKEIANNLSPNVIKRFGLISALQSFCEKVQNSSGINIRFDAEKYENLLKSDEEISVYRIVSELVNNTVKHAGAKNILVSFLNSENGITLIYTDDGKGFDFESAISSKSSGLGLQNIISRISSFNGVYATEKPKNGGFGLKIYLPNAVKN